MKMQTKRSGFLLFAGLCAILILNCSPTRFGLDGPTTQTGNGMVAGIVHQPDGKAPANNVSVYLRKKNSIVDISDILMKKYSDTSAITKTNSIGEFSIDSIDTGIYTIECTDGGNNLAVIDSVSVRYFDSTVVLPPVALKPAGAIKGAVRLAEGGNPRKVFVIAAGIDRFTTADTNGLFTFERLAEGKYWLEFQPTLDNYGVLDTMGISVTSAETTDIGVIELPFTGIPIIKNPTASYDTLQQKVTISWDRLSAEMVKSFNVYRRAIDPPTAIFTPLNFYPIIDTFFIDSLCEQDRTYEYRVTAVDSNANEGPRSEGKKVHIALYDITPKNFAVMYDTLKQAIVVHWSNPDTTLVTGYNVYRRNIDLNEEFWTPFNERPIADTCFIDSLFNICANYDSASDCAKGPTYEYCAAALIKGIREGTRNQGKSIRISVKYLTPTDVKFSYDTLKQAVSLRWSRPDTTLIKTFHILRRNCNNKGDLLSQINRTPVSDTWYIDSTAGQNQTYEYCIASIVASNRAEVKSAAIKVRIAASYTIADSLLFPAGSRDGELGNPSDIAVATNGEIYIVDQSNSRIQVFDSAMQYKRQFGAGVLHYPLKVSVDNQGSAFVADFYAESDQYSIVIFDALGMPIDTIDDSLEVSDLDARDSVLYVLRAGRFMSRFSYGGRLPKRLWQVIGQEGCKWMVAGDPNNIFVSTGATFPDKNKVYAFDSLGNKTSSISFSYFPYAIAFQETSRLLYVVCYGGSSGSMLHVFDGDNKEVANYKIQSDEQKISIGIQKDGAVLLAFRNEGKLLKLKPLF
jgi:hypothetical protein